MLPRLQASVRAALHTLGTGAGETLSHGGAAGQRASDILRSPVEQPGDLGGGVALDARKSAGALGALRLELAFPLAGGRVLSSQRAARSSSRRDSSNM